MTDVNALDISTDCRAGEHGDEVYVDYPSGGCDGFVWWPAGGRTVCDCECHY